MPSGAGDDPKVRRPASADWMTEVPLRVPILTKFGNSAGVHPEIREAVSRICDLHHVLLRTASRMRSEEHTSELQSLMRISYAVFCLKKKKTTTQQNTFMNNKRTNITKT